ncbi:MAG: ABC-2 type transport system permease protein [Candidatus Azotimanducaceae bacterium]|jgi:ABC-2 type transport system permease protein
MCVMSIFFFVVTRNRYVTMFLVVLYAISLITLPQLGFEHYLYRFDKPGVPYSVFTGYSHLLTSYLWYTLYLSLWGLVLLIVVHLLWPRGSEFTWRTTLKIAKQRFTKPVGVLGAVTVVFLSATGGDIFYNTTQLNRYMTNLEFEEQQADYEKQYKQYENLIQPATSLVYAEVDIYPEKQEATLNGHYDVRNNADEPIPELHLVVPPWLDVIKFNVPGAALKSETLGYYIFEFREALKSGQALRIDFETAWLSPGFVNNGASRKLAANGTFFNNFDLFPSIGYQRSSELQDNARRRKYDLPPAQRMPDIDDEDSQYRSGLGSPNRVAFETMVSTSLEQQAIAPGYLQSNWQKDDRNYFHYKMDVPIWNFFSYLSADFSVKRKQWNDVAIEVYYKHEVNVDRMIYATERSLEYFEDKFTPYQYQQFRIIEFPRYQGTFAQSFPNTVPFSETIGFVADLRDKANIDYVFYVTAHELAHQWWAHQVLGADVQGQTMIVETLAQYFALMVMKNEYGEDTMKKFLEYELDRYLQSRGGELIEELPLYLVENQPYIHYHKGSIAMYALQDYIGEDKINAALKDFLNEYAFKGAPYPTTRDLIASIRQHAGPEHDNLVTDMLEKIVLFDQKVDDTFITEREDGQFDVTIEVSLAKFEANGAGEETEIEVEGLFDIALLGEKDQESGVYEVQYLKKYPINSTLETITIVSDKKPMSVGIDPFNKLIDRNPEDNIKFIDS